MPTPRRIVRQLRTGTYRPSNIGAKAREAARRRREIPPEPPQQPPGRGAPPREPPPFSSIKNRMKVKKHYVHRNTYGYNPRGSARQVEESDAYDEMVEALEFTNDEMAQFASLASKAWHQLDATGDAGELAVYLAYDFLWYH